jgi:hypothetical protein
LRPAPAEQDQLFAGAGRILFFGAAGSVQGLDYLCLIGNLSVLICFAR